MSAIKNRRNNPITELAYQEIDIPNDRDLGTGAFRFQAKKDTMTPPERPGPKAISAAVINPPRFQISAAINPGTKEIPVLLGRADGTNPLSSVVFLMPAQFDIAQVHDFEVSFSNWQVTAMTMDGQNLSRK
jgi:hypothetical protein